MLLLDPDPRRSNGGGLAAQENVVSPREREEIDTRE
jgi:hypothetical protein